MGKQKRGLEAAREPWKDKPPKRKLSKKRKAVNITVVIFSILFLLVGGGCMYADGMLGLIDFQTDDEEWQAPSNVETGEMVSQIYTSINMGEGSAGLYHDDAVMNILLLGVDDYQANDVGRSDSQILITIDTRHQKIKLTSFMRDMYVNIPGYGANRINTAYTFGGPKLTVQTLESLFGVDIDRYVCVNVAQFRDIINTLGGVTIELTQAEADLINENSGESYERWVSEGTQRLTGKQAWYYARIRAIGNDQARTERQRKVIESVVDNLKSKDLFTLNSILAQVLGQMSTNMSRNEVLALVANAMTYLNYPIESTRLPVDGTYNGSGDWVYIGGLSQNVIIPDLQANSEHLVEFLYEDDIPEKIR